MLIPSRSFFVPEERVSIWLLLLLIMQPVDLFFTGGGLPVHLSNPVIRKNMIAGIIAQLKNCNRLNIVFPLFANSANIGNSQ